MSKANPDYLIGSFTKRKREGNIDTEKLELFKVLFQLKEQKNINNYILQIYWF